MSVEMSDAVDLEKSMMGLLQKHASGINNEMLQTELPQVNPRQRVDALNKLLTQGKIEICKRGEQLLYKLKKADAAAKPEGANSEERVVYQIIREAGNRGIWIRDIRSKSNLSLIQLNKILRNMESKKMIKSVKSVLASKKKVYMLYNLEPDRSVTGGVWYSEQDFDSEFVELLNQQCHTFLKEKLSLSEQSSLTDPILKRNASYASSEDICTAIKNLGVSKVPLSIENIESVLETLILDGKVEKKVIPSTTSANGSVRLYRVIKPLIAITGLMRMPCGVCPVINDCHEGGAISPETCQYMSDWLKLDF